LFDELAVSDCMNGQSMCSACPSSILVSELQADAYQMLVIDLVMCLSGLSYQACFLLKHMKLKQKSRS
jgi:hypothetical protein